MKGHTSHTIFKRLGTDMDLLSSLSIMLSYRKLYIGPKTSAHDHYDMYQLFHKNGELYPGCTIIHYSPLGKGLATNLIKNVDALHCIVVCDTITRQGHMEFEHMSTTTRRFEILHPNDFAFEKPKNRLVPRYEVLSMADVQAREEVLKCPRTKWAKMCVDDPMARYMGLSVGQIVYNIDNDVLRVVVNVID